MAEFGALGIVLAVLGIVVTIYFGRRSAHPTPQSRSHDVQVRVANAIPVYDLPGGRQDLGDHHVSVEAVNMGDRPVALVGWGIKLPGDRRMVVTRPVNWSTPLPHELRPGAPPARLVVLAEDLRRLERDEGVPYSDMRPYVTLADGTEVFADRSVPLA